MIRPCSSLLVFLPRDDSSKARFIGHGPCSRLLDHDADWHDVLFAHWRVDLSDAEGNVVAARHPRRVFDRIEQALSLGAPRSAEPADRLRPEFGNVSA